jgi:ABC-2 type transport system ATP-binding protein
MSHRGMEPLTTPRAACPGGPATLVTVGFPTLAHFALAAHGIAKTYHAGVTGCSGRVDALRGIDLEVAAGEAFGVLGAAGAGKSTLLLCLAGLLRPDAGTLAWFGRCGDEGGRPPGIAYVAHGTTAYAFMTVREAIEYQATLRDIATADRSAAVHDALEAVGLTADASAMVGSMARGAGARLALAQALVGRPRVLLLDETLSGMTPAARRDIVLILRDAIARGITIVVAADELDAIDALVSRVGVLLDGRLAAVVTPDALRQSHAIEITVASPAIARRIFGARVAEVAPERHVLRVPLAGTSPEAILARCQASGLRVETSRIVITPEPSRDDADEPSVERM